MGTNRSRLVAKLALPLMLLGGATIIYVGIDVLLSLPTIPYNVRDMFPPTHRMAAMLIFAVMLLWVGFAPGAVSRIVLGRKPEALAVMPIGAAVVALLSWFYLRFAVANKSLLDIVGSATVGMGQEWERIGRFLALGGGIWLLLILGGTIASAVLEQGWRRGAKLAARSLAICLPLLVVARIVVINWASTDNLTELLRTGPVPGDLWMMLWFLLMGANAAVLAHAADKWRVKGLLLWAFVSVAMILPGWAIVNLALEPNVHKYGLAFPAIQFLLGPDRQTSLSVTDLMLRWSLVQGGAVLLLAYGWLMARVSLGTLRARSDANAPPTAADDDLSQGVTRRFWVIVMLVYIVVLLFASFAPLDFRYRPIGEVWRKFWDWDVLLSRESGPADIAVNLLGYVPLAFLAMSVFYRPGGRRRNLTAAAGILLLGATLSVTMEFFQMFLPAPQYVPGGQWVSGRASSFYDILSQALGSLLGLGLWALWGPKAMRQVKASSGGVRPNSVTVKILIIYVVGLLLYQMSPFDFTFRASSIVRRIKPFWLGFPPAGNSENRVVTIPFTDPIEMPANLSIAGWIGHWLLKLALLVPVGLLCGLLMRKGRHPVLVAAMWATLFMGATEFTRLFLLTRSCTATDVIMGAMGSLLGALIGVRLSSRSASRASLLQSDGPGLDGRPGGS